MVPHALPLSNAALIAANLIGYGLLVLIAIVLWLSTRKHQQPEQLLGLKVIGYLLSLPRLISIHGRSLLDL